ncbi:MAG: hypothetical protein AAF826_11180 [Pseudomonadota bacterium]
MPQKRVVNCYFGDATLAKMKRGELNFLNIVKEVLEDADFDVHLLDDRGSNREPDSDAYALFYRIDTSGPKALTIRENISAPFWCIEQKEHRWDTQIARATFHPDDVDPTEAGRFTKSWARKWMPKYADATSDSGYVYIPLQGKLTSKRSFQTCSPIEMIAAVLRADPYRTVIANLHPGEKYTNDERAALDALLSENTRLSLSDTPTFELLANCDYLVCQNSTVAFYGVLLGKTPVFFGRSEFHHAGFNVHHLGPEEAIRHAMNSAPAHAKYIWWYLQEMSINAGRPEARSKIADALRSYGWPL